MLTGGEVVDRVVGGETVAAVAEELGVPVAFIESIVESPLRQHSYKGRKDTSEGDFLDRLGYDPLLDFSTVEEVTTP